MGPNQFADQLRKIATGIEKSKNPDRAKVAGALKGVLAQVAQEQPASQPKGPSAVASELRAIADGIDNSKKPDRGKVASAIKGVLSQLG